MSLPHRRDGLHIAHLRTVFRDCEEVQRHIKSLIGTKVLERGVERTVVEDVEPRRAAGGIGNNGNRIICPTGLCSLSPSFSSIRGSKNAGGPKVVTKIVTYRFGGLRYQIRHVVQSKGTRDFRHPLAIPILECELPAL